MSSRWRWRQRYKVGIVTILAVTILFYPKKVTVAPSLDVRIVDRAGRPMPTVTVSELWIQTAVERRQHLDQVATDSNGNVHFPARTMRSPLAERILGCLGYKAREGFSAACGSEYSLLPAGDLRELSRRERKEGLLRRQVMLTLTECDPRDPASC